MPGEPELTVLSLGAGVQSSVLALMAACGQIQPLPDYAIFADTGWEPQLVYDHVDWLESQLPFPIIRVSAGDIRSDLLVGKNSTGQSFSSVPLFVRSPNGAHSSIVKRQCTREYKLTPIERELRDLLGLAYRQPVPPGLFVELWIGISTDEAHFRMKPSRQRWIEHRWPLLETGISRSACVGWFAERFPDRVLPRSACIGCPYHTDAEWQQMRDDDPASWDDAVFVDRALRQTDRAARFDGEVYLHKSLRPLGEIAFATQTRNPIYSARNVRGFVVSRCSEPFELAIRLSDGQHPFSHAFQAEIPWDVRGLYAFWLRSHCLYVGMSTRLHDRLREHRHREHNQLLQRYFRAFYGEIDASFVSLPESDEADLRLLEKRAIQALRPAPT